MKDLLFNALDRGPFNGAIGAKRSILMEYIRFGKARYVSQRQLVGKTRGSFLTET